MGIPNSYIFGAIFFLGAAVGLYFFFSGSTSPPSIDPDSSFNISSVERTNSTINTESIMTLMSSNLKGSLDNMNTIEKIKSPKVITEELTVDNKIFADYSAFNVNFFGIYQTVEIEYVPTVLKIFFLHFQKRNQK